MQLRRILNLHAHFLKEIDTLYGSVEREGAIGRGGIVCSTTMHHCVSER